MYAGLSPNKWARMHVSTAALLLSILPHNDPASPVTFGFAQSHTEESSAPQTRAARGPAQRTSLYFVCCLFCVEAQTLTFLIKNTGQKQSLGRSAKILGSGVAKIIIYRLIRVLVWYKVERHELHYCVKVF